MKSTWCAVLAWGHHHSTTLISMKAILKIDPWTDSRRDLSLEYLRSHLTILIERMPMTQHAPMRGSTFLACRAGSTNRLHVWHTSSDMKIHQGKRVSIELRIHNAIPLFPAFRPCASLKCDSHSMPTKKLAQLSTASLTRLSQTACCYEHEHPQELFRRGSRVCPLVHH